MYNWASFSCSSLLRIPLMLLTIYQINMATTTRPTKITNTNLLFCLSQLCWSLACSFSFEFQPVPCTVGTAFTLVVVDDEEGLEAADDEREEGVALEAVDEAEGEGVNGNDEDEGTVDEMLLLLLIRVSVGVAVVVALLISVVLMVVCASAAVIRHARNSIKSCFDRLIIQGKRVRRCTISSTNERESKRKGRSLWN